jgi:phytoene synthase
LGNRAAWAVLAAARIYGGIGRKVRKLEEAGLANRVSTTKAEKAQAVALALGDALVRKSRWPMPGPSREGLWTMPE